MHRLSSTIRARVLSAWAIMGLLWGVRILKAQSPLPLVVMPTSPFDFGTVVVGETVEQTFTITNRSPTALSVFVLIPLNLRPVAEFSFPVNTCSQTLAPLTGTCLITVRYTPVFVGSASTSVNVNFSDPTPRFLPIEIRGTGQARVIPSPPLIDLTPSLLDFALVRVGTTVTQMVTLTNRGDTPLTVGTLSVTGDAAFSVPANACDTQVLISNSSCTITVGFTPRDGTRHAASLQVPSNAFTPNTSVVLESVADQMP